MWFGLEKTTRLTTANAVHCSLQANESFVRNEQDPDAENVSALQLIESVAYTELKSQYKPPPVDVYVIVYRTL